MQLTEAVLLEFLKDSLGVDTKEIKSDTLLFSSGMVDSFSLVSLLTFIESNSEFRIDPIDVNLENLDSIDRILKFADRVQRSRTT
jgi:acyl carrier protein